MRMYHKRWPSGRSGLRAVRADRTLTDKTQEKKSNPWPYLDSRTAAGLVLGLGLWPVPWACGLGLWPIPPYPALSRLIPASPGLSWPIPLYPALSAPSRPIPPHPAPGVASTKYEVSGWRWECGWKGRTGVGENMYGQGGGGEEYNSWREGLVSINRGAGGVWGEERRGYI